MFCWNVDPAPLMLPLTHVAPAAAEPLAAAVVAVDAVVAAGAVVVADFVDAVAWPLLSVPHAATLMARTPPARASVAVVRDVLTR